MIDFRYHLVSLVSVFLALAVGVVLGAGPLRGQIADSLNSQVDQLRQEKNQLRADLTVAEKAIENRDTFTEQVTPELVAGRLTGRSVVLVVLPGADTNAVDPLVAAVQAAGGSVTGQLELTSDWVDPASAQARRDVGRRLSALLTPLGLASGMNMALAQALVSSSALGADQATSGEQPDPVAADVVDVLAQAGMLDVRQDLTARAGLVVVLAPAVEVDGTGAATQAASVDATTPISRPRSPSTAETPTSDGSGAPVSGSERPTVSASASGSDPGTSTTTSTTPDAGTSTSTDAGTEQAAVDAWARLALQLDRAGDGAVVLGPASAAEDSGVLRAVRSDDAIARRVSTVDLLGSPMGDVVTVMALQEQLTGSAGAYGFGRGAGDVLPSGGAAR